MITGMKTKLVPFIRIIFVQILMCPDKHRRVQIRILGERGISNVTCHETRVPWAEFNDHWHCRISKLHTAVQNLILNMDLSLPTLGLILIEALKMEWYLTSKSHED